jgi:Rrf2 family protein
MKLSPAAELAIRGMIVLAERYGGGPVPITDICSTRDLPRQYLTKIFSNLARARLISPVRGKHGGYTLARPGDQITLLEIIEAVEGPIALNYCQHTPPKCDQSECPIRGVWGELQDTVRTKLGEIRLSECVGSRSVSIPS